MFFFDKIKFVLPKGYGPHGRGQFKFLSKPTQEVVAHFERGYYLRKYVPFEHIDDLGLITQEVSIPYEHGCYIPFCFCDTYEDYRAVEISPHKRSPVPKTFSSRYSSPTTTTSSFSTPRERTSTRSQHEVETHEETQYGEVFKCYVNVFDQRNYQSIIHERRNYFKRVCICEKQIRFDTFIWPYYILG